MGKGPKVAQIETSGGRNGKSGQSHYWGGKKKGDKGFGGGEGFGNRNAARGCSFVPKERASEKNEKRGGGLPGKGHSLVSHLNKHASFKKMPWRPGQEKVQDLQGTILNDRETTKTQRGGKYQRGNQGKRVEGKSNCTGD